MVLCDLGGVLIELDWLSSAKDLFGDDLSPDSLLDKWLSLESVKKFETGLCSFDEFYRFFCSETHINRDFSRFRHDFVSIIGALKPDCEKILCDLKEKFHLALLSNTNYLHIEYLREKNNLLDIFDHLFLSYEMQLVKPEPQIYEAVCRQLNRQPEEIFFFDDNSRNVAVAKMLGIKAFQATSPGDIREIMAEFS